MLPSFPVVPDTRPEALADGEAAGAFDTAGLTGGVRAPGALVPPEPKLP